MAASFVVGATKVIAGSVPRVVVLFGESELIDKLKNIVLTYPDTEFTTDVEELYTAPMRYSHKKVVILQRPDQFPNWVWLGNWLNNTKRITLVIIADSEKQAEDIARVSRTRGLLINCSAPTGDKSRSSFVKLLTEWYPYSATQIMYLLSKNDWNAGSCLQLLDKLTLLKLPLSTELVEILGGVVPKMSEQFTTSLLNMDKAKCIYLAHQLDISQHRKLLPELSGWLDLLGRVKHSNVFLKPVNELAREVDTDKDSAIKLIKQSKKYDQERIQRATLAVAQAERDFSSGYTYGVIENMVNNW